MKPISTEQFALLFVVTTVSTILWMLPGPGNITNLAGAGFCFAPLILSDAVNRRKVMQKRTLLIQVSFAFGLVALVFLGTYLLPEKSKVLFLNYVKLPVVILPIWLLLNVLAYRRWKLGRKPEIPHPEL